MKYLFIDGGFLDAMLDKTRSYFGLSELADYRYESIAGRYSRTFYYDAYPQKKGNQSEEDYRQRVAAKERRFRSINLTPGVHTREGITRNRTAGGSRLEQKGVDILLAIDVFKHAMNGNMSEAHIMTTDIDFFPLFEALRDTPVSTHLHCFPADTSEELMFIQPWPLQGAVKPFAGRGSGRAFGHLPARRLSPTGDGLLKQARLADPSRRPPHHEPSLYRAARALGMSE